MAAPDAAPRRFPFPFTLRNSLSREVPDVQPQSRRLTWGHGRIESVVVELSLEGKSAIVTGGASGIGRGICLALAGSGAKVAVFDIDEEGARKASEDCSRSAASVAVRCDVTGEDDVERAVGEARERLGGLDILVNNAGIAPGHPLTEFPLADWQRTLDVNLTGYFLMGRACARVMIDAGRGGAIINISSKTGVKGSAEHSAYSATKFGEIGLTQSWARELARHRVRVNAVCPGNVLHGSGIWSREYREALARKHGIELNGLDEYYIRQVPLGRPCTVEDVANVVVFLASDESSYITGCTHLVDGGQEMR